MKPFHKAPALVLFLAVALVEWSEPAHAGEPAAKRPNILWITCEDMSPDLGCYGDPYSVSPNLDRLASQGVRFTRVFSHAGVCAPSRSGLITGMYPSTLGTQHMRSQGVPPAEVKCFPEYLRAAGYYCTNNSKTDYNFAAPPTAWDESGNQAHWRGRAAGQPFFAVFNILTTHESQIRAGEKPFAAKTERLQAKDRHDPTKAVLPPYYPDTPIVRRDWARYYDLITAMDLQVADRLAELDKDGLADETIVFFFSDHGRGLTRAKRCLYDSGTHVPMIVRWPGTIAPGMVNDELVAFIDLAPTVLSLAGVRAPDYMQGRAFLGQTTTPPREYVYGARDRMDERYDIIRAVRDKQFKYIRNYQPWKPYAQHIAYAEQMPTLKELRRLHAEGKLEPAAELFFRATKPVEELYDTVADPHEIHNLAASAEHREILQRLRAAHLAWARETKDLGLLPEPVMLEFMRPGGQWDTAATPELLFAADHKVTILSPASVQYALTPGDKRVWHLYTNPVQLDPGQSLVARACRLGFKDSPIGTQLGTTPSGAYRMRDADAWRRQLVESKLLDRVREVALLGEAGPDARAALIKKLGDDQPAVRYWAIVGLGNLGPDSETATAIRPLLVDAVPTVQVAAAEALCKLGQPEDGVPILLLALAEHDSRIQLQAALALDGMGSQSERVTTALRALALNKQTDEYTARVAEHASGSQSSSKE